MAGIICKKIGMTRVFDEGGASVPCTVLESGPCIVTQIKDQDNDGYSAIQLAFGDKKEKNTTKPLIGHFKKASTTPKYKLVEFRNFDSSSLEKLELGMTILPSDVLEAGDYVDAIGTSKGKGFQGVVKRHGFSGVGDRTHGQHNRERAPGSIGGASYPSRVFKGMRMAGRMGGKRVTVQNLQVLKVLPEKNLVVVNGAVPGAKNGYIILQK